MQAGSAPRALFPKHISELEQCSKSQELTFPIKVEYYAIFFFMVSNFFMLV